MCLYPSKIFNPHYKPNSKNNWTIPECNNSALKTIEIGCGFCYMCKRKKANEWKIRLYEENKTIENERANFVSLTITDENIKKLELEARKKHIIQHKKRNDGKPYEKLIGYKLDNAIATLATRRFLERWRKENKKSVKHWFTTELGQTNTERIHIHGIIWSNKITPSDQFKKSPYLDKKWMYGNTYVGKYVNEKTMTYVSKYITKTDKKHPHFKTKILTTPGIGKSYLKSPQVKRHTFNYENTKTTYINKTGIEQGLPMYYKKKIWNENQSEWLWLFQMDKKEKWIWNERIDISTPRGLTDYQKLLKYYRILNKELGYGGRDTKREQLDAENKKRELLRKERMRGYKRRTPLNITIPNYNISQMKNYIKPKKPYQVFEKLTEKIPKPDNTTKDNSKYWGYQKPMTIEKKAKIIKILSLKKWEEITR